jgi:hypothetical protein
MLEIRMPLSRKALIVEIADGMWARGKEVGVAHLADSGAPVVFWGDRQIGARWEGSGLIWLELYRPDGKVFEAPCLPNSMIDTAERLLGADRK